MTQPPPRRRLVYRVYAFSALIAIAVMAALLILPRYTRSPTFLEPQAALVQHLVDRWSTQTPQKFAEAMVRIDPRLKGTLALYDAKGTLLHASSMPPLPPPSAAERAELAQQKWSLTWEQIAVRSDDGQLVGIYQPRRPSFPWGWVLPLGAILLLLVGAASYWFTRRLAIPLERLASAARRFGAGDIAARADVHREDELGDVGRAFDDMAHRTAVMIRSQRQLMADVSHELRTPLARIRVALELVVEDPVAAKDVLADVGGDLDEIDQLISDILTTARLDGEQATLTKQAMSVGELADRASQRFAARHPGRVLEREIAGAERGIECDPVLLRRALDNLLDNAAKYSDAPVTLAIRPATAPGADATVAFEIVDRGIGMSADDLERAFTPFWRADGSRTRKTGGVGLGLALARRIARAHGGDVVLASSFGKGTTARLEVPTT